MIIRIPYRVPSACLSTLLAGCSPYALIERRSGPPIEARIVSSDPKHITIGTTSGQSLTIERDEVTDIDHPGNVAMALGLPNTVVGSLFAVITVFMLPAAIEQGWPEEQDGQLGAAPVALGFGTFAAVNLAIGLPPFLWGSDTWFTSTGNAQPDYGTAATGNVQIGIGPGGFRVEF